VQTPPRPNTTKPPCSSSQQSPGSTGNQIEKLHGKSAERYTSSSFEPRTAGRARRRHAEALFGGTTAGVNPSVRGGDQLRPARSRRRPHPPRPALHQHSHAPRINTLATHCRECCESPPGASTSFFIRVFIFTRQPWQSSFKSKSLIATIRSYPKGRDQVGNLAGCASRTTVGALQLEEMPGLTHKADSTSCLKNACGDTAFW